LKIRICTAIAALVLSASACSRVDAPALAPVTGVAAAQDGSMQAARHAPVAFAMTHPSHAASLPDHGELAAYPGKVVRRTGAYTWHRAAISEAHALQAIATGTLRLTTPDGRLLSIRYDRHVEHPSGDWTWVGHLAGDTSAQTVLTIGQDAVFGNIAQGQGLPLRLTMKDGVPWLVETDAAAIAAIDSAATRPQRPDYHIVPQASLRSSAPAADKASGTMPRAASSAAAATTSEAASIDVLIGYTQGLVAAYGNQSAVMTRLNYLVDLANTAYFNGGMTGRLHLVHAMQVTYVDDTSNDSALEEMSGYEPGSGPVDPDPAFDALRAARETYGADLVSLVRDFRDPENDGCGIAWLLGGGLQGMNAGEGWDQLGYSVVSDGSDVDEGDGKSYFCRDTTFAHELGHNMGAAHDTGTAMGDDGVLDNPDDYGAYTYSFGYKTSISLGNFFTIMAYGDSGQTGFTTFSTPDTTFCGGKACGTASADNVRTLTTTMPVVAGFRGSQVVDVPYVRDDFDGDGTADILWRNLEDGHNTVWHSADQGSELALATLASQAWKVAGIGDFDGDGIADIFWQNVDTLENTIWKSGNSATLLPTGNLLERGWALVGVGDFDADGEDDVVWRNGNDGRNTIWRSGDKAHRQPIDKVPDTRFHMEGVGDFDGDGHDDILWRNSGYGKNVIWFSGTKDQRLTIKAVADVGWHVVGVGDFDADGRDDLMWRHSVEGRNSIWKGAEPNKLPVNTVADVAFKAEGTRDYDGDGKADILWRNASSGKTVIWPSADRGQRRELGFISLDWMVAP
jgi:hypothetical protein